MSLQDDMFDVAAELKGKPEAEQFADICEKFSETEEELDEALKKVKVFEDFKALILKDIVKAT